MKFMLLSAFLFVTSGCSQGSTQKDPFFQKRRQMVESQIEARGIHDGEVIQALLKVPRHLFVPVQSREQSYEDHPLDIGFGQTISQPYIVAYMTEQLHLKSTDKVLEIGTGSGYQAAILAELAKEVYSIEIVPQLAFQAKERLKDLGYKNIYVKEGDGYLGWPDAAPFDAIILTAAPSEIPLTLKEQLADGGRLIVPVGDFYQELVIVTKDHQRYNSLPLLPVRFVPMIKGKKSK
jgi:protein-L-isoaspartate(D-aspartate) O-methyltransferase